MTMGTIEAINLSRKGDIRSLRARFLAVVSISDLVIRLGRFADRRRQRRDLLDLTDDQLRDIGLTRAQARREAARPFWD
ncbi:MAG: DUF1127 domain-containing protein [Mesorhizobium sp.]